MNVSFSEREEINSIRKSIIIEIEFIKIVKPSA